MVEVDLVLLSTPYLRKLYPSPISIFQLKKLKVQPDKQYHGQGIFYGE